ncbi:HDL239Wp [Eremothecium sinecaudum]|uniref:HDL239Wp n=1 Tax=Eremothecium sinecaudum TaxID=45286 RepID=A0A120K257_9SACH|nr:HDL239Wp [Eremothecium sinecaudum]AMD20505.1 HDL239Wp [Eremothecium sinecaudum]
MSIAAYLIVAFVVFFIVVSLPFISGIASYKINVSNGLGDKKHKSTDGKKLVEFQLSKGADLQRKHYDIDGKTGLKRRNIRKVDSNISSYDYDIEELIAEDEKMEQEENDRRYEQFKGKENERVEDLA